MEIIEFKKEYTEQVKDLLVELQNYIVQIDDWHLNIITPKYREMYFKKTIMETNKNQGKIFLAVENNKALGLICGAVVERDKYDKYDYICPKTGEVFELIVSANERHGGVGCKLLEHIENYFKSIGCEYCHIEVFEPNKTAKSFYNKHKYVTRMCSLSKKL